jgi:hypothetical protein
MTPNEFKAWFDGFTEAFTGCPTKVQWTRIKDRVAEIDGKPITERVYVDRYWPTYYPTYTRWPSGSAIGVSTCTTNSVGVNAVSNMAGQIGTGGVSFNSMQAMSDLGRAEAKEIARV